MLWTNDAKNITSNKWEIAHIDKQNTLRFVLSERGMIMSSLSETCLEKGLAECFKVRKELNPYMDLCLIDELFSH